MSRDATVGSHQLLPTPCTSILSQPPIVYPACTTLNFPKSGVVQGGEPVVLGGPGDGPGKLAQEGPEFPIQGASRHWAVCDQLEGASTAPWDSKTCLWQPRPPPSPSPPKTTVFERFLDWVRPWTTLILGNRDSNVVYHNVVSSWYQY
jgi:hypothetical protein